LNDKFTLEIKQLDKKLAKSEDLAKDLGKLKKGDYQMLTMQLNESTAILKPEHFYDSRNVEMQKLPSNHTFLEPGDQVLSSSRSRLGKYLQINCSLTFLTIVKNTLSPRMGSSGAGV